MLFKQTSTDAKGTSKGLSQQLGTRSHLWGGVQGAAPRSRTSGWPPPWSWGDHVHSKRGPAATRAEGLRHSSVHGEIRRAHIFPTSLSGASDAGFGRCPSSSAFALGPLWATSRGAWDHAR